MSRAKQAIEADFAGLDACFKKVITPKLDALEGRRKHKQRLASIVFVVMFFLGMPTGLYLFWKFSSANINLFEILIISFFAIIFSLVLCVFTASAITKGVRLEAKRALMEGVTDHLGWMFQESPERPSVIEFLKKSKMFVGLSREEYEDGLAGQALGHNFTITEAKMQSNVQVNDKPIFSFTGVVLSIDFPKQMFGTTILRLKHQNYKWRKLQGLKKIGFASSEFQKKYEVYGTDPTESYYLFSPDIMASLLDVAIALGGTLIACVYWEGTLNLMITAKDRYEVKSADEAFATEKRLKKLKKDLASVYSVIEKTEHYFIHRKADEFQV